MLVCRLWDQNSKFENLKFEDPEFRLYGRSLGRDAPVIWRDEVIEA